MFWSKYKNPRSFSAPPPPVNCETRKFIQLMRDKIFRAQQNGPIYHAVFRGADDDDDDDDDSNTVLAAFEYALPSRDRRAKADDIIPMCRVCDQFLAQYGDLSIIRRGKLIPLMWSLNLRKAPEFYKPVVENLLRLWDDADIGESVDLYSESTSSKNKLGPGNLGCRDHLVLTVHPIKNNRLARIKRRLIEWENSWFESRAKGSPHGSTSS